MQLPSQKESSLHSRIIGRSHFGFCPLLYYNANIDMLIWLAFPAVSSSAYKVILPYPCWENICIGALANSPFQPQQEIGVHIFRLPN